MHNDLRDLVTEYTVPLGDSFLAVIKKNPEHHTVHYAVNNTHYTAHVNHPTLSPDIPEDAEILYTTELSAGRWSATICKNTNASRELFVLNNNKFITWGLRLMPCFEKLISMCGHFDTEEEALEACQAVKDEYMTLTKEEVLESALRAVNESMKGIANTGSGVVFPKAPEDLDEHREIYEEERVSLHFVCYPSGDRSRVTVIDLDTCQSYERDEWATIDDTDFHTAPAAIKYARDFARANFLIYEPFDSRYGSKFSEVKSNGW